MALIHYTYRFIHLVTKEIILEYPKMIEFDEILPKNAILIVKGVEYKVYTEGTVDYDNEAIIQFVINFNSF